MGLLDWIIGKDWAAEERKAAEQEARRVSADQVPGRAAVRSVSSTRDDERELLLRRMPSNAVCAEIGVWRGDFSAKILEVTKPTKLHLIDPWKYQAGAEYSDAIYGGRLAGGQETMDSIYLGVLKRFEAEIKCDTIVVHRSPSENIAPEFADEYFDWIYIDGNHLYEFVKHDLESMYAKVKPGGFITGREYLEGGWWKGGVLKAVNEFASTDVCEPLTVLGTQFVLRRR